MFARGVLLQVFFGFLAGSFIKHGLGFILALTIQYRGALRSIFLVVGQESHACTRSSYCDFGAVKFIFRVINPSNEYVVSFLGFKRRSHNHFMINSTFAKKIFVILISLEAFNVLESIVLNFKNLISNGQTQRAIIPLNNPTI